MIVVSDTTPLITLLKVKHIDLLEKCFGGVQIPVSVFEELTCDKRFINEAEQIRNCPFIKTVDTMDSKSVDLLRRATGLDLGESEAIILTDEIHADLLLMDEARGRDVAEHMGLRIMGTIGLLMSSYEIGILSGEDIRKCIEIIRGSGRYIGEKYLQMLLDRINKNWLLEKQKQQMNIVVESKLILKSY